MPNTLMMIVTVLLLAIYLVIFIRFCRSRFGAVKKVTAVVVHKQKVAQKSYRTPPYNNIKYAVTFQMGNRRKSFYVSELSYQGYRKGEKGTLSYRGDRLIDFH